MNSQEKLQARRKKQEEKLRLKREQEEKRLFKNKSKVIETYTKFGLINTENINNEEDNSKKTYGVFEALNNNKFEKEEYVKQIDKEKVFLQSMNLPKEVLEKELETLNKKLDKKINELKEDEQNDNNEDLEQTHENYNDNYMYVFLKIGIILITLAVLIIVGQSVISAISETLLDSSYYNTTDNFEIQTLTSTLNIAEIIFSPFTFMIIMSILIIGLFRPSKVY